jgi:hypothetical protein
LEYVLLVGIITIVLFTMMQQVKRGTQSVIKVMADEIMNQQEADQSFDNRQGFLEAANTTIRMNGQKSVNTRSLGVTNYIYDDRQEMFSNTHTNMGFTEEQR